MTRFDDLFDSQPADQLEAELRRLLAVREADITEPARPRLAGEQLELPAHRTHRISELPGGRTGTLLAAAVVALLVLGSALAARGLEHRNSGPAGQPTLSSPIGQPTPSPTPSRITGSKGCPLPASWASALAGGKIAVDQPQNQPVSAGPDGTFLMLQTATGQVAGQIDFTHQELAVFDRNGHGTTIWTAADPAHDYVDVSQDSATSADWVVYGLTRSQNLAAHGVVAWNRATGQSTTVRLLSAAEESANTVIDFDPIVIGDTAHWIEQKYGDNAHQTLVSLSLPAGQRSTEPVSGVSRLVAVSNGVGLLHDSGSAITLTAGPGLDLPADIRALAIGTWFGSDGTTLHWLDSRTPRSVVLRDWRPAVDLSTNAFGNALGAPLVGPFLGRTEEGAVYDTRSGSTVLMPAGTSFVLVTGGDLISVTGSTKFGGNTVHRVPLSALPPAPC
ncbi:MAG TPA: hypothetical protein VFD94_11930 [Jatrophihabitans sp.]|jgi:hypothetical protein|nr:hypothetical protein [Jatrophihabitans sp.]